MKIITKIALATVAVAALTGTAMAADLVVPPKAAPAAAPSTNWDGAYIGANVGYGWGTVSGGGSASTTGWEAGGQVGYMFHLSDQVVGGVEGVIDWTNESTAAPALFTVNWNAAVLARLGLDVGQWLPYIEGGVAFAGGNVALGGGSATQTGYTLGAGVEVMLADQVSANLQYRYTNTNGTYSGGNLNLADNSVSIGIDYHF